MSWVEAAVRSHKLAERELARQVNRMAVSVPIGDSDASAPGYLLWDKTFSCIPDVQYPWDPEIVKAIRTFQPDMVPALSRTTIRYSNYYDNGRLGDPITLVRHVIARAIIDPIDSVHNYPIEMPGSPQPGLLIPGRTRDQSKPNYIELELYDRDNRDYGFDYPGHFQPFDWAMYYNLLGGWTRIQEVIAASRRVEEDGKVKAQGAASQSIAYQVQEEKQKRARRKDETGYVRRDIDRYHSVEPSDVQWKEALLGEPKRRPSTLSLTVPGLPAENLPALASDKGAAV